MKAKHEVPSPLAVIALTITNEAARWREQCGTARVLTDVLRQLLEAELAIDAGHTATPPRRASTGAVVIDLADRLSRSIKAQEKPGPAPTGGAS